MTTHYVYGAGGLLYGEYDNTGAMVREYVYLNGAPLAQVTAGSPETVAYLHTDHLGTPRYATNSGGTQVWSWTNDAFGTSTPSGSVTVNLRMPGQYYDSESGLFYNWNRYYNPAIGRYVSSDPIGLAGGQLNTFGYVAQNPVYWTDPWGLMTNTFPGDEECELEGGCHIVGGGGGGFNPQDLPPQKRGSDVMEPDIGPKTLKPRNRGYVSEECPPGSLPKSNPAWGKNRLTKELYDRGYKYDKPTTGEGGSIYKNSNTGEEIRIMPKPERSPYSQEPSAKFENEWYYRYRSDSNQPWGPAISIPNK